MGQTERRITVGEHLRPIKTNEVSHKMGGVLRHYPVGVGDNLTSDRNNHKQHSSGKDSVHPVSSSLYFTLVKRLEKMATAKMMLWLFDFLGVPIFIYTSILNFGEVKGYILFGVALLYALARLLFFVDKQIDESKMRKLQLKKKEHDVNVEISED